MIKLRVQFSAKGLGMTLKSQRAAIRKLPEEALKYFIKVTPIDTGNARRNTRLVNKTIRADYPYARRLDREAWSKQAPKGMTVPTLQYIIKRIKAIMKYRR